MSTLVGGMWHVQDMLPYGTDIISLYAFIIIVYLICHCFLSILLYKKKIWY